VILYEPVSKIGGIFLHVFLPRILIWQIAGFLDAVLYAWTHGSGVLGEGMELRFAVVYLFMALILGFLSLVYHRVAGSGHRATEKGDQTVAVDMALAFLLVIGYRINEVWLPSILAPVSMGVNAALLCGAALIVYGVTKAVGFRARMSDKSRLLILIAYILSLSVLFHGLLAVFFSDTNRPRYAGTPDIVLVTLDTVRADHLGCYGYDRDTSPSIDAFAKENHLFTNCRTPMPLTAPAHASLFSGKMPNEHGVFTNTSPYPAGVDFRTLAEDLWDRGYRTAGFPAAVHIGRQFNFDRGFRFYNQSTVTGDPQLLQSMFEIAPIAVLGRLGFFKQTYLIRDSDKVNIAFFDWIGLQDSGHRPFFAWLHYFDAHAPYNPPEEYWRRFDPDYRGSMTGSQEELDAINAGMSDWQPGSAPPAGFDPDDIENLVARYDGEIRHIDDSFKELLDFLVGQHELENTVIIVVSDHGEGLYDDGYFGHNYLLKEDEIRVSCIIKGPQVDCGPGRQLSLTDISDYIRELAGMSADGCRLCGAEESPELGDDPYASMVFLKSHSWIEYPFKLIRSRTGEGGGVEYGLFDFVADPMERMNLYSPEDLRSIEMRSLLQEWLDTNDADFPALLKKEGTRKALDPATLEMLRSLGYIY
jgi:arylsulfatase